MLTEHVLTLPLAQQFPTTRLKACVNRKCVNTLPLSQQFPTTRLKACVNRACVNTLPLIATVSSSNSFRPNQGGPQSLGKVDPSEMAAVGFGGLVRECSQRVFSWLPPTYFVSRHPHGVVCFMARNSGRSGCIKQISYYTCRQAWSVLLPASD